MVSDGLRCFDQSRLRVVRIYVNCALNDGDHTMPCVWSGSWPRRVWKTMYDGQHLDVIGWQYKMRLLASSSSRQMWFRALFYGCVGDTRGSNSFALTWKIHLWQVEMPASFILKASCQGHNQLIFSGVAKWL